MTVEEFKKTILNICDKDTSSAPTNWTEDIPAYGHCAVVSVLAQDKFGGIILKKSYTKDNVEYSHYLNKLPNENEIDFTIDQFNGNVPNFYKTEERTKERILSKSDTLRRYNLLVSRFDKQATQKMVFFGDSMLANISVDIIKKIEEKTERIDIYNCGTGGMITLDGLNKAKYISDIKPDIVLLCFGINDILKYDLKAEDFLRNLEKIISFFSQARIIIWSTPKINNIKDVLWSNNFNKKMGVYNEAIIKYCNDNKKEYINSFLEYNIKIGEKDNYHEDDGVHLTDGGYSLFVNSLVSILLKS